MFLELHYSLASRRIPQALSSQQGFAPLMRKLILKNTFPLLYKKSNSENQLRSKKQLEGRILF